MIANLLSLSSDKIYDRQLLLTINKKNDQKSIVSTLSEEQKRERMIIVFEVGKVAGRKKVISREEHEAFLTLAYIGDVKALTNWTFTNDQAYQEKLDELKKLVNNPDLDYVYDYCMTFLRKKHWTTNEICSDFRIEK